MARIFISYRRSDSAHAAGRIYDRLSQHFSGSDSKIFIDVHSLGLGDDFKATIEDEIGQCDAVVAIIGRN